MACLELQSLNLRIAGVTLIENLNLEVETNECWALLGKNGAGKTSLLHSIIGINHCAEGMIKLNGQDQKIIRRAELATRVGILFQEGIEALPTSVLETVMLGRHPHTQSILKDDPKDVEIARRALKDLALENLEHRLVDTLSGGERQRLAVAMLVAQMPQVYLLDEPSNHLDVANQVKLLSLLKLRISERFACLLMATHDINLAARFCDHVVLLMGNGAYLKGPRQEILTEDNLSTAYDCTVRSLTAGGKGGVGESLEEMTLFYPT
ncbi:MAG: ABC transporter ATP-binding protein [Proteobacteria bacterium]|nr:ABC transporter ATP-binding protein [Pseudomonadota bacterium]